MVRFLTDKKIEIMKQDEILKILFAEACKDLDKETEFKHGRTSGKMEAYSHAYTLVKKLTIPVVSQRSELLSVFDGFYEWHKKQGYVSIKRDDFEEYLKTLNCG